MTYKSFFSMPILGQSGSDAARSEYEKMQHDVAVHDRKLTELDKARREAKFADVMAEESTATATEFDK